MKKVLMIASALFAVGALLFAGGAVMAKGDMSVLNIETGLVKIDISGRHTSDAFRYTCPAEGVDLIKIDAVSADTSVTYWDGSGICVLSDSAEGVVVTPGTDGTLTVTQKERTGFKLFMIDFGRNAGDITVMLPSGLKPDLAVSTVSGDVEIGVTKLGGVRAGTASGDIRADSLNCGPFSAETVSGDIDLGAVTADTLSVSTTSGDVELDYADAPGGLLLSSVSGGIVGTLSGAREDYTVSVSTVSGESGLIGGGTGPVKLSASTVSGDIDIRFKTR